MSSKSPTFVENHQISVWHEAQRSLRFSLPLILSYLVRTSSPFMSVLMVAHLGADALAAAGLASIIYLTVLVFFFGVISATSVLVAHNFGADNKANIGNVVVQGFWIAAVFGIPLMLLLRFVPLLIPLSGQKGEVLRLATSYLNAVSWSMLPLITICIMEQFLIGIGRTKLVLWISMLQIPCEIAVMYVFIFGKLGLPVLGVTGVGYSVTLVFVVATVLEGLYLYCNKSFAAYHLFKASWKFNRVYFFDSVRIGLPMACSYAMEVALFAMISFFMGRLGRDALAAHQIGLQYVDFVASMIFAIAQSTSTRIGHLVGMQDKSTIKRVLHIDIVVGEVITLVAVSSFWFLPRFLVGLDFDINTPQHQEITRYAIAFLAIGGVMLLCDNMRWVLTGALRALKDTSTPMCVVGVVFWFLVLPGTYFCGLVWGYGGVGIWWVMTAGIFLIAGILYLRLLWLVKRVDLTQLVRQ